MWAKAMEGVKILEMQPRRTLRRKGRGTVSTAVVGTGETRLRPSSETSAGANSRVDWERRTL